MLSLLTLWKWMCREKEPRGWSLTYTQPQLFYAFPPHGGCSSVFYEVSGGNVLSDKDQGRRGNSPGVDFSKKELKT